MFEFSSLINVHVCYIIHSLRKDYRCIKYYIENTIKDLLISLSQNIIWKKNLYSLNRNWPTLKIVKKLKFSLDEYYLFWPLIKLVRKRITCLFISQEENYLSLYVSGWELLVSLPQEENLIPVSALFMSREENYLSLYTSSA